MNRTFAILAFALLATTGAAGLTTTDDEPTDCEWGPSFQLRGGRPNNGDWELGAGDRPGQAGRFGHADRDWENGVPERFEATYDAATGDMALTVAGASATYTAATGHDLNSLRLWGQARRHGGEAQLDVTALTLDGTPIGVGFHRDSAVDGGAVRSTWVTDAPGLTDGFTLTGEITLTWENGAHPKGDRVQFLIETASCAVPVDPDTDGDGLDDDVEIRMGCLDPTLPDTDGDGVDDGDEVAAGRDPCRAPVYEARGSSIYLRRNQQTVHPGDTGVVRAAEPLFDDRAFTRVDAGAFTARQAHAIVDLNTQSVRMAGAHAVPNEGEDAFAQSELEEFHTTLPDGRRLEVRGVYADAYASCDTQIGVTRVREILVDGVPVKIPGNAGALTGQNGRVDLGPYKLQLNSERDTGTGFDATAFWLHGRGIDVRLGHAHAAVYHCTPDGATAPPPQGPIASTSGPSYPGGPSAPVDVGL